MQTAYSIIKKVRDRRNLPAPTSIESASDPDELQQLELLYATCEELLKAKVWAVQKM